jgi:tetratricopeptide (TPR) repeat protein
MYRLFFSIIVALSAFGMTATLAADDTSTCAKLSGDDAIAACSRLIKINPKHIQAYFNRGRTYIYKGDNDAAIADLDVVARFAPNNASVYYNRSLAYYNKGDYDRSIADDDQALRLDPNSVWAYADRGRAYNAKNYYDRAIIDYDQAIRLDPNYAIAYIGRGVVYTDKHEYDRAIADLDQAIRLDPKSVFAYSNRGAAYAGKGDYDHAIADLDQAIRLDPKSSIAYNNRGVAYSRKGDYDLAIGDFDQAIRLDPKNANAYNSRANAYSSKGDHERAIADADQAIRLDPKTAAFYVSRSDIYTRKGDHDRAIADADEAIRIDPKDAIAYNNRGEAYEGKNDPNRALADFEQALKLNPNDVDARRGRERVQVLLAKRSDPGAQTASAATALPVKRALVIGINAYPNLGPAAQLERAAADADAVGDRLASLGFQVTRLTTARDTTLDGLIHGFDGFRKTIAKDDMVVLFFAGHGMGLPDGTYLVPSDVREASLQVEASAKRAAISEDELTAGLRKARARIVVAVIDACRNDLFSKASQRALGERGLRPVETEGIFKLYSASEGQTALDRLPGSDGSRNSVFTRVFLKAIGTPGLNLNTLGATVRDEVHELARTADHEQTPAVYDKLIGSTRVYFAGETAAR